MKRFILAIVFVFCCSLGMTPPAEAGLISKEQEIEMGRQTAMQLEAKYGVVQDYALQERVNRIGQSLVKVSERQDLEYSFKVLNSDEVNALACPGGFIYVFKGLIDYMPSDAELAGVLGHEITHVVKKHTVHQIEKQLLTTLAFAIVTKGDLGIAGLATQALAAGYSRTDERGADKGGFVIIVVKKVEQAVVYVLSGHGQFGGSALFAAADDDRIRHFYRRVISGAAVFFKRMVQKVKCALEIAAADGQQGQNRQALFGDNLQHDFIPFVFFMKNLPLS